MPHPKALPAAGRLSDIVCDAAGLNPDGHARTMIEFKKRPFGIVLDAERGICAKAGSAGVGPARRDNARLRLNSPLISA